MGSGERRLGSVSEWPTIRPERQSPTSTVWAFFVQVDGEERAERDGSYGPDSKAARTGHCHMPK